MTNATKPGAADEVWTPIFSTGEHLGITWRPEDLAAMARNFKLLAPGVTPPITVGHDEAPILPGFNKTAQPALGHISDLRVDKSGTRLEARLSQVPDFLKALVRAGRYGRVSSEIIP